MDSFLKCSKEEHAALVRALGTGSDERDQWHGFEACEWSENAPEFYMYAKEHGEVDELPAEFLELLGRLMPANHRKYVEIGTAFYCDKMRPGEFGGTECRITPEGKIIRPEIVWPKKVQDEVSADK
jgi:hypothetical protein